MAAGVPQYHGCSALLGVGLGAFQLPQGCGWPCCRGHVSRAGAVGDCLSLPPTPQGPAPSLLPAMGDCKKLHELVTVLPDSPGSGLNGAAGTDCVALSQSILPQGLRVNKPKTAGSWTSFPPSPGDCRPGRRVGGMLCASITAAGGGAQADIAGSALGSLWGAEPPFHGQL